MDLIQRYRAWFAAFEQCVVDDQWQRLAEFLTEDAEYRVEGTPLAEMVSGRDAILAGFKKSIDGFDRKLDRRIQQCVGTSLAGPDHVIARTFTAYEHRGVTRVAFPCREETRWRDGRIAVLTDVYEPEWIETQELLQWFGQHAPTLGLDPSYH